MRTEAGFVRGITLYAERKRPCDGTHTIFVSRLKNGLGVPVLTHWFFFAVLLFDSALVILWIRLMPALSMFLNVCED